MGFRRLVPILAISGAVILTGCNHSMPLSPLAASRDSGGGANHPGDSAFTSIPLGGEPYGVAVSASGQVFVARVLADLVSPMRLGDGAFAAGINVENGPSTVVCDTLDETFMGSVHVAFNPAGTRAYVTDQFGNAVSVLDPAAHTLLATIPLGDGGFNLGVSPNGARVYATTAGGHVRVISAATNTVVDSMVVGSAANGVAFSPDGATVYVSSRDAGTITAFRTSDDGFITSYAVGGRPQRIAVSPDGATLYAANEDQGLDVVTLSNGTVTTVSGLTTGYGLGITPDGAQLWVTSPGEGRVYIVDRQTLAVTTVQLAGGVVPRNVAFNAAGTTGVVTDGAGNVLFLNRQGTVQQTLPLGGEPYGVAISSGGEVLVARVLADSVSPMQLGDASFGRGISVEPGAPTITCDTVMQAMGPVHVALNPAGSRAYVTDQFGNAVSVIDAANRTLVATIRLGDGGFNLGVSPDGQRVYATTAGGRVYVIATSSNTVVDSLTVGSAPNGVAFAPGGRTVYISSRDAGTVTAFNTSTLQQVAVYQVGGAPQRLAVSLSGNTLYAADEVRGLDVVDLSTGTVTEAAGLSTGYGLGQTPDGKQLWVTSPLEGVIYIVDPTTNTVTRTLNLGTEIVPRNVAFSADGKTAVVTNGAGSVLFFK